MVMVMVVVVSLWWEVTKLAGERKKRDRAVDMHTQQYTVFGFLFSQAEPKCPSGTTRFSHLARAVTSVS